MGPLDRDARTAQGAARQTGPASRVIQGAGRRPAWDPPADALPGPFGAWELLCSVGAGARGWVWLADHREGLGGTVAVKFLADEAAGERLLSLAEVLAGLEGPYLAGPARVLDLRAWASAGWPPFAVVSTFLEPSLARVLADASRPDPPTGLPPGLLLHWVRQLVEAVEALHQRHQLVHGGLTPSNVLIRRPLDRRYQGPASLEGADLVVADLEFVRPRGQRPVWLPTDPRWTAPERTIPTGLLDPAEDFFSVGRILLALLENATGLDELRSAAEQLTAPRPADRSPGWDALWGWLFRPARPPAPPPPSAMPASWFNPNWTVDPGTDPNPPAAPVDAFTDQVPGYAVEVRLGEGGMGIVWAARGLRDGRQVALKVLRPDRVESQESVRCFQREVLALSRLDHPNVARILDSGLTASGVPFLVTEWLEGETLQDRLRAGPLPPVTAAAIVADLAGAIGHAHAAGVVHRDLKPANVLVSGDGHARVIDFGLARLLDDSSGSALEGAIAGTPGYMAPEQARGDRNVRPVLTDVYGLGATLYALLTGRPPSEGSTKESILARTRAGAVPPPRRLVTGIPPALEDICLRCLRHNPYDRYQDASQVAVALRRFLQGRGPQRQGPGPGGGNLERLQARLLQRAHHLLRGVALAGQSESDLVQQVFLQAVAGEGQSPIDTELGWFVFLKGSLRNLIADCVRRSRSSGHDIRHAVPAPGPGPDAEAAREEQVRELGETPALQDFIRGLPEGLSDAEARAFSQVIPGLPESSLGMFSLYLGGLSHGDIASKLGLHVRTVEGNLSRIKEALRDALEDD